MKTLRELLIRLNRFRLDVCPDCGRDWMMYGNDKLCVNCSDLKCKRHPLYDGTRFPQCDMCWHIFRRKHGHKFTKK